MIIPWDFVNVYGIEIFEVQTIFSALDELYMLFGIYVEFFGKCIMLFSGMFSCSHGFWMQYKKDLYTVKILW